MRTDAVEITIDGHPASAEAGWSVAAAVLNSGVQQFRRSNSGEARAPLCGMGICYECRVTIDGRTHQKACQIQVAAGMNIRTDE